MQWMRQVLDVLWNGSEQDGNVRS